MSLMDSSPKNENYPMIYSPLRHPRCIWFSSFRRIQSELYYATLTSYIIRGNCIVLWKCGSQRLLFINFKYGYFLSKMHQFTLGGLYSPPGAMRDTFYYRWMCFIGLFRLFKITPTHCHYKAWKSQDIFKYNSDWIRLKEESPRMAWGWVNYRVIFSFGWTIPLKNVLALSSFIMTVNGVEILKPKKVHPSIVKVLHVAPGG